MIEVKGTCPDCRVTVTAVLVAGESLICPICDAHFHPTPPEQAESAAGVAQVARHRRQRRRGIMTIVVTALLISAGLWVNGLMGSRRMVSSHTPKRTESSRAPETKKTPLVLVPFASKYKEISPAPPAPVFKSFHPPEWKNLPLSQRVNLAIDHGLGYLREDFQKDDRRVELGLVGLTMLECGAAPDDPIVAWISDSLRKRQVQLRSTYPLSLALMFFDRLGQAQDKELIQMLANRLRQAQLPDGTWTYLPLANPIFPGSGDRPIAVDAKPWAVVQGGNVVVNSNQPGHPITGKGHTSRLVSPGTAPFTVPAPFELPAWPKPNSFLTRGDHSNTQFALLALWIASRHHAERTVDALQKADAHFLKAQHPDGSWGYADISHRSRDSMTCAGLLGLGLGHGAEIKSGRRDRAFAERKNAVAKGLRFLEKTLERRPRPRDNHFLGAEADSDLYFLWSLDRLAMAYQLRCIGKTAWYPWAAELLAASQHSDGSWLESYGGPVDTCFALLVLKRSNLAEDLTTIIDKARGPDGAVLLPTFIQAEPTRIRNASPLREPLRQMVPADPRREKPGD
jgi:hypothetical protein